MTLIYGHRGAKGEAPENTLVSFQQCLEHGVRRCELDLHLSRDGELMVIHDPTLKRTTCLLYTSPSPRDQRGSRMPSSA